MKRIYALTLLTSLLLISLGGYSATKNRYHLPAGLTSTDYLSKTIVFRVDPAYRAICRENIVDASAFRQVLGQLGEVKIEKLFPGHQPPATAFNEQGLKMEDLSLIYKLQYTADVELVKAINAFLSTGLMLYAEPKFIPKTQYNPNDPSTGAQYFLTKINAYGGWDIHKGDTNTVIGITDTGSDMDHPDLEPNIKYNYNDPIDGIDNDADGYTDNFRGWDLGEGDNFPEVNASSHGSHVSGCAAAVTDNGSGVASPGFYCKFLPVKIADASGALTEAYEGIVYAADHGCQIINCSWGGEGGGSLGQNVVDYATVNKNSLVIAAAGNNSSNVLFYPASYNNVLCVASTGTNDAKSSFSNYGSYIDLCAPGSGIYTAIYDNAYQQQSGTSMASPVAAGCAAIVKSYFPTYNALQVGEKLRITCDNIYSVGGNSGFQNQLGTGRVNLLNALTLNSPAVRMNNIVVTDNNDNILVVNDTMRITGNITNYLDPTTNLVVTLTTTSPYVTIIDGSTTVGALATMGTTNNTADPFVVKINPNAPLNIAISFKLIFQDGLYNDFQMFTQTVNVDYLNITINDVFTTNSSKGRICYNGTGQADGLGFDYLTEGTLAYETGFMVGIAGNVADNVRGATGGSTDEDFQSVVNIQKNDPGVWSEFDTYGIFNDNTNSSPLNLRMNYKTYSWSSVPYSKFHIFEYTIRNNGTVTRNNLYAGIFSDWDIQNYANNKADEDLGLQMGYVYCTDPGGYYAGIKLLTPGGFRHYAIDNVTGGGGGLDASNGFDSNEKYTSLSTNRPAAGGTGTGNDVIDVVGTGPYSLAPGDSVTVAFALIAGSDLGELQSGAVQAQVKYSLTTGMTSSNENLTMTNPYPNPAHSELNIPFSLNTAGEMELEIFDMTGRVIMGRTLGLLGKGINQIRVDLNGLAPGLYHFRLSNDQFSGTGTFIHQ